MIEAVQDLSGQVVKGYEFRQRIGMGGFGAVYRAYQPTLNREVAIKVILPQYARQPDFIRRFDDEARTVAALEHPYIVPLFDYWQDDGGAYLVMRWLRGGSVRATLQNGALPIASVARIIEQISAALATAHDAGVIHRDLKPDNLLLDEQGNAYLTDFGIAVRAASPENQSGGMIIGSYAYMSPEQREGRPLTPQSDLYSLGLVIYAMLSGGKIFSPQTTMHLVNGKPAPHLREVHVEVTHTLDNALHGLIARATADDPAARYPDAVSMAAALKGLLQPETPTAARDLKARVYARPDLLPKGPLRLIGRETLLHTLAAALETSAHVLLVGLGGMGKTTLAAAAAAAMLRDHAGGIESVIWLEAGAETADMIFEAIARALGEGQAVAGKTGGDKADAVRELLAGTRALLVLDNTWNDAALFSVLRALPGEMRVLVTSRHLIPIEGAVLDVGELTPDQALELLGYYAGKPYTGADTAEARALCKQLGYHTYALEIAGKVLKAERHLTPARLIARIADAPHDLRVPGQFAEAGRESIKSLLDASVAELPITERAIFTAMGGLYAPRASLRLLAGLMAAKAGETAAPDEERLRTLTATVTDAVTALEGRGLAELVYHDADDASPDHYQLHDLTYSYARALHKAAGVEPRAAIAAVRGYVDAYTNDYDRLDFEQVHILEAACSAQTIGDGETLLHLMDQLNVQGNYYGARGHSPQSLELLRDAIHVATALRQTRTAHFLWSKLGNTYANYLGDLDKALEAYQEAVRLAVVMGDTRRQILLLGVTGTVRFRQNAADADTYLKSAYDLAKRHHDDLALSQTLEFMGYQAGMKEDHSLARRYALEALEVAERLNNPRRLVFALLNLGVAEQKLSNLVDSLSINSRAYQLAQLQNDKLQMAYSLTNMGEVETILQNRPTAQDHFNDALRLLTEVNAMPQAKTLVEMMSSNGYDISQFAQHQERKVTS